MFQPPSKERLETLNKYKKLLKKQNPKELDIGEGDLLINKVNGETYIVIYVTNTETHLPSIRAYSQKTGKEQPMSMGLIMHLMHARNVMVLIEGPEHKKDKNDE
jgi:hypothetical protein